MKIFKNFALLGIILIATYFFASFFGDKYQNIFGGSTWVDVRGVLGLPLAFIFFLTFLFTSFGSGKKYWWIGILLIPAFVFELYFDVKHIYLPISLCLVGWLLGLCVNLVTKKFIGAKTEKIEE